MPLSLPSCSRFLLHRAPPIEADLLAEIEGAHGGEGAVEGLAVEERRRPPRLALELHNLQRVLEHEGDEAQRRRGHIDGHAGEAGVEERERPAVVEVRVGEDDHIGRPRFERRPAGEVRAFAALVAEPRVNDDAGVEEVDESARRADLVGAAHEMELVQVHGVRAPREVAFPHDNADVL